MRYGDAQFPVIFVYLCVLQTKAKPDAEGDAFFLDSNDEQSSEKAPVRSPMPAAAVAVPQRKRARADFTASLAQESVSQQAQQAQDATGVLHEQPPARRQALLTLPQHKKAAAKRVRTSSMVDVPGFGNAQQDPEQDRPAALQPSHHAAQPTAHVLPKPGPIVSLGPAENGEQSATKAGLARRQTKDGRSRAVSAANEVCLSGCTCQLCVFTGPSCLKVSAALIDTHAKLGECFSAF